MEERVYLYWISDTPSQNYNIFLDGVKIGNGNDENYEFELDFDSFKHTVYIEPTSWGTEKRISNKVYFIPNNDYGCFDIEYDDTDKDGVPDVYERLYGTNPNNPDTDGDGLTDYEEIYILGTDPLKKDTDGNGINDGDEDFDGDGLTNLQELRIYKTDPWNPDTDGDGLLDGDEVKGIKGKDGVVYKTDPLKADTDGDGVPDGDELALGLNPLKKSTDGVRPDNEVIYMNNKVKADNPALSYVNNDDSPFILSIDMRAAGLAANNTTLNETPYSTIIQSDAIIGNSFEMGYNEACKIREIVLNFEMKEAAIKNEDKDLKKAFPELAGMDRFCVFKYIEEYNMLVPIETVVDGNNLSVSVDSTGTFCVMDLMHWLDQMGQTPYTQNFVTSAAPAGGLLMSPANSKINNDDFGVVNNSLPNFNFGIGNLMPIVPAGAPISIAPATTVIDDEVLGSVDIIYILDRMGTTETFNGFKEYIRESGTEILENSIDARVYVIGYSDFSQQKTKRAVTEEGLLYATTVEEFNYMLDSIKRSTIEAEKGTYGDALYCISSLPLRRNVDKFAFLVLDHPSTSTNCKGYTFDSVWDNINLREVNVSAVMIDTGDWVNQSSADRYTKTGGIMISYDPTAKSGVSGASAPVSGGFMGIAATAGSAGSVNKATTHIYNNGGKDVAVIKTGFNQVKITIDALKGNTDIDRDGVKDICIEYDKVVNRKSEINEICLITDTKTGKPIDFKTYYQISTYIKDTFFIKKSIEDYCYLSTNGLKTIILNSDPFNADGDFDGIDDLYDNSPLNNNFKDTYKDKDYKFGIDYKMDYTWFFGDNIKYNKELSAISSIFSSVVYSNINLLNKTDSTKGDYYIDTLMKHHGMSDVKIYELTNNKNYKKNKNDERDIVYYEDQHLTAVAIGHRKVEYNGKTKEIFCIAIRGTNSTTEEWSSNFDIGCSDIFNNDKPIKKNADWKIVDNHMGFDIAATRVINIFNTYLNDYSNNIDSKAEKILWITGHSRGGAIANIVGARLTDNKYKTFVYTFAAPMTTLKSESVAKSYKSIFNIINDDDIVAKLPLSDWKYRRFGTDYHLTIKDSIPAVNYEYYTAEWEKLTGKTYKANNEKMESVLEGFKTLAENRDDCYKYTCSCHGNGNDDIMIYIETNVNLLKYGNEYCIVDSGFRCETTAYFMQYLAHMVTNQIKITADTPKKYVNVKWNFIEFAIGDNNVFLGFLSRITGGKGYMDHPHQQVTYYYLSRKF